MQEKLEKKLFNLKSLFSKSFLLLFFMKYIIRKARKVELVSKFVVASGEQDVRFKIYIGKKFPCFRQPISLGQP